MRNFIDRAMTDCICFKVTCSLKPQNSLVVYGVSKTGLKMKVKAKEYKIVITIIIIFLIFVVILNFQCSVSPMTHYVSPQLPNTLS